MSLLIAAYNEEKVIRKKLENALSLNYPKEKLEVVVVSDASTDRTNEIVLSYADKGVRLVQMEKRGGKTRALNEGIKYCKGEIIVLSDADTIYHSDSLFHLLKHFGTPDIGVVCGELRYVDPDSVSGEAEGIYWRYEQWLKHLESRFNTLIGANGAIYALRKKEYVPMDVNLVDDLMEPILIYLKYGKRIIYEPNALGFEKPAETFIKEYKRKIRTITNSFYSLLRTAGEWIKKPMFAFQVISHKILRWLVPIFLILLFGSNLVIVATQGIEAGIGYIALLICQIVFYMVALRGFYLLRKGKEKLSRIEGIIFYFCMVNTAALLAIWKLLRGKLYITWQPHRSL